MKDGLIFVYNADSGLLNAARDLLHKTVSPQTYDCALCAVTYGPLGMRREWRDFVRALPPTRFLHRDELAREHGIRGVALPAAWRLQGGEPGLWLTADELRAVDSLDGLMALVRRRLDAEGEAGEG